MTVVAIVLIAAAVEESLVNYQCQSFSTLVHGFGSHELVDAVRKQTPPPTQEVKVKSPGGNWKTIEIELIVDFPNRFNCVVGVFNYDQLIGSTAIYRVIYGCLNDDEHKR
jgi:hypothetical protein